MSDKVSFTTKDGKKVSFKPKKKGLKVKKGSNLDKALGAKKLGKSIASSVVKSAVKKVATKPKAPPKPKKAIRGTILKGGIGLVQKDGTNKGNIPNKKLKCFMRTAPSGGTYRTCVVPEKKKAPKHQVRGKPRAGGKGGERVYASDADRKKAEASKKKKARATKNPKRQTITKADGSVGVVKMKTKAQKAQAKRNLKDKQKKAGL